MALPNQVGGHGKGVVSIKPNQSKYKDYGLLSVKEFLDSVSVETPKLLPKTKSDDLALAQNIKAMLGEKNNYRLIHTPLKPVLITKKGLKHISEKRQAARERCANFILPTLMEPNKIWLTAYEDGSLRRRFIKLFKGKKSMLVIARENVGGSLFWNAIPAQANYIDNQRIGVLLYKNHQSAWQAASLKQLGVCRNRMNLKPNLISFAQGLPHTRSIPQ